MSTTIRPAEVFPPGEFVREELEARGWSQTDLAAIMDCAPRTVNEIIRGKRSITPETAVGLAAAFDTSADLWLNLENAFKLHTTPRDEAVARRAKLFALCPVKDLQRRGWIGETDSIAVLEHQVNKFMEPLAYAARKSESYDETKPALAAWLCRVKHLASASPVTGKYSAASLEEAFKRLRAHLGSVPEVRHVPRVLSEAGVRFVVVEHLPHTKIDGATLWLDNHSPVVALSARYDRIDWFWFTLVHELFHVQNGDGKTSPHPDEGLVGEGSVSDPDESTVNEAASAFLIPKEELEGFIRRVNPLFSRERVKGFANRLGVHPALAVGQLQHRRCISPAHMREFLEKFRSTLVPSAVTDGWGFLPQFGGEA